MRRWIGGVAVIILIAAPPAGAAASDRAGAYVALGDSYSSGTGTGAYYDEGCERSFDAYPQLLPAPIGGSEGPAVEDLACAGARIGDVVSEQIPLIAANAALVTITIGGNDGGFGAVMRSCALPWPVSCEGSIARARDYIRAALPSLLADLFTRIRAAAPRARVVVLGYPRLFGPQRCPRAGGTSISEQEELNAASDLLREAEHAATAASGPGFEFADPTALFRGHAICSPEPWLNGITVPLGESFHPNRNGHRFGYFSLLAWTIAAAG